MRFWMDFGWLLERCWVDFGSKLEAKLEQSWHQKRKKKVRKLCQKKIQKKIGNGASDRDPPSLGSWELDPRGGVGGGVFSKGKKKVGSRHLAKGRRIYIYIYT